MLLVYHNHVFIHLLLFSPAILSLPPQLSLSSLALLFFITHPLIQYSPYLPFLFNPSSTTPPDLCSTLCLKASLHRDETVALTHLAGRLFIGFISITRLLEKTHGSRESEEGSKMKEC